MSEPLLSFTPRLWSSLLDELARRSDGRRESGAFLMSSADSDGRTVRSVCYYDDLDATALRGGLRLGSAAFTRLWDICERDRLKVAADVHTHPWSIVGQSGIDRANPMISRVGYLALIVPNFGRPPVSLVDIGLHRYLGNKSWQSWFGADVAGLVNTGDVR